MYDKRGDTSEGLMNLVLEGEEVLWETIDINSKTLFMNGPGKSSA